jgi:hypothetical protein
MNYSEYEERKIRKTFELKPKDVNRKLTKKELEDNLNDMFSIEEAQEKGCYLAKATRLLSRGLYGTALRKYDPIAFNLYCQGVNSEAREHNG